MTIISAVSLLGIVSLMRYGRLSKKTKTSFLMIRVNMEIFGHILVLSEIQG